MHNGCKHRGLGAENALGGDDVVQMLRCSTGRPSSAAAMLPLKLG